VTVGEWNPYDEPDGRVAVRLYFAGATPDAEWLDIFNRNATRLGEHAPVVVMGDHIEVVASNQELAFDQVRGIVAATNAEASRS
jgi:hypothetical protein